MGSLLLFIVSGRENLGKNRVDFMFWAGKNFAVLKFKGHGQDGKSEVIIYKKEG